MSAIIIKTFAPAYYWDGEQYVQAYWDNEGQLEVAYYGIDEEIPIINNRTIDDVNEWSEIRQKMIDGTATEEEASKWNNYELIGCLTHLDLNRWGRIMNYLAEQGIQIVYPYQPKTDWAVNDDITPTDVAMILEDVQVVRSLTGTPSATPQVPNSINDYHDANDIEEILRVGDETIRNTQLGYRYCGEIYASGSY